MRVFISSPYTLGSPAANVRAQIDAMDILIKEGASPFLPLLFHFADITAPQSYEDWLRIDLDWLRVSDAVLRLPGESKGADGEVAEAKLFNIPVYFSIDSLIYDLRRNNISRVLGV